MAYKNGFRPSANAHGIHTVYVHLGPRFTERWGNGRYAASALEQYLGREMRLGYMDVDEGHNPRLRFPERNVVIPLHPRDSVTSVDAFGFYHTREHFQLGRKKIKPASINGKVVTPGVVRVWWDVMY